MACYILQCILSIYIYICLFIHLAHYIWCSCLFYDIMFYSVLLCSIIFYHVLLCYIIFHSSLYIYTYYTCIAYFYIILYYTIFVYYNYIICCSKTLSEFTELAKSRFLDCDSCGMTQGALIRNVADCQALYMQAKQPRSDILYMTTLDTGRCSHSTCSLVVLIALYLTIPMAASRSTDSS